MDSVSPVITSSPPLPAESEIFLVHSHVPSRKSCICLLRRSAPLKHMATLKMFASHDVDKKHGFDAIFVKERDGRNMTPAVRPSQARQLMAILSSIP